MEINNSTVVGIEMRLFFIHISNFKSERIRIRIGKWFNLLPRIIFMCFGLIYWQRYGSHIYFFSSNHCPEFENCVRLREVSFVFWNDQWGFGLKSYFHIILLHIVFSVHGRCAWFMAGYNTDIFHWIEPFFPCDQHLIYVYVYRNHSNIGCKRLAWIQFFKSNALASLTDICSPNICSNLQRKLCKHWME